MVPGRTGTVGDHAERYAKRFLIDNGLQPIASNFRCRLGEIDLVMRDRDCIVFVEVRYRSGRRKASASDTVDAYKQRKLVRTAAMFLARQSQYANCVTRFDVVGIDADAEGLRRVRWLRDAFRPADASL